MTLLQATVGMKNLVIKLERLDQKNVLRAKSSATKRKGEDIETADSRSSCDFVPIKTDTEQIEKTFTSQTVLRIHEPLVHRRNEKTIACQFCTKSFNSKYIFQHLMTHTKEKPYKCTLCKSAFGSRRSLRVHVQRVHDDRDPEQIFTCKTCKKSFPFKAYLAHHVKLVHSNRVLPCSYCSKLFTNNADLRKHELNMHTGRDLRPFSCVLCNKSFKYKCHLNDHIRLHTGEKHSCEFCVYTTPIIWNLKKHVKRYHAGDDQPNKNA